MATDLPYAADAEVSLTYDELEVLHRHPQPLRPGLTHFARCCGGNTSRSSRRSTSQSSRNSITPGVSSRVLSETIRSRVSDCFKVCLLISLRTCTCTSADAYACHHHQTSIAPSQHGDENASTTLLSVIIRWETMTRPRASTVCRSFCRNLVCAYPFRRPLAREGAEEYASTKPRPAH
jgi:hypothetical protein